MFAKLDVSWRGRVEPIDVLVNPRDPKDVEALLTDPARCRVVRFQLGATGVLWFADGFTSCHGDESRGRLIASSIDPGFDWRDAAEKATPLIYGYVWLPEWCVEAHPCGAFLCDIVGGAQRVLHEFKAWRRLMKNVAPKEKVG